MSDNKSKYKKFANILKGKNKVLKGSQPVYKGTPPAIPKGSHPIQRGPSNPKFKWAGSGKFTEGMKKYFKKNETK